MPQMGQDGRLYFELRQDGQGVNPAPWLGLESEEGEENMKSFAFVGLGLVAGFAVALGLLPEAQGANDVSAYRQLDLFSDAFERVRANYVRPVEDSELINAAIQGMVSNLDPHSSYMDAKTYGDMQITTKGQFGGVGIEVTKEDGLIKVISPIDGTPAAKAGIKAGDCIAAHRRHVHRRACRSTKPSTRCAAPPAARSRSPSCAKARRSRST